MTFEWMIEIKVRELLVDRKKVGSNKTPSRSFGGRSVSDLKDILGDENLSSTIDLEGVYEILTNFISNNSLTFLTGTTKRSTNGTVATAALLHPISVVSRLTLGTTDNSVWSDRLPGTIPRLLSQK